MYNSFSNIFIQQQQNIPSIPVSLFNQELKYVLSLPGLEDWDVVAPVEVGRSNNTGFLLDRSTITGTILNHVNIKRF